MAFWGVILLMVVIFLQPQEFVPLLKGLPLVRVFSIIMFLFSIGRFFDNKHGSGLGHQDKLMVIFWLLITLSTAAVGWIVYTSTIFFDWAKIVLVYFLITKIIDSLWKLEGMIIAIIISAVVTGAMGILQWYGIDVTGVGFSSDSTAVRIRGVGIFDTNQLAYTMAFLTPLSFAMFKIFKQNQFIRLLAICIIFVFNYTIFLTNSRGGLICSVIVICLLFSSFTKKNIVRISGFVFAGLLLLLFVTFSSRLKTVSSYEGDASAMGRLNIWGEALINLKSCPLGIGKDQFESFFKMSPHNSYIQVVSELGILGLLFWVALFYFSIKYLKIVENHCNGSRAVENVILAKSLQISLYAYLFGSLFSGNAYYITLYILFALVVVLQNLADCQEFLRFKFAIRDGLNICCLSGAILMLIHFMSRG